MTSCGVSSVADAFVYTVGQSGLSGNCSFPTVQQALDAAARTAEDDEIWITRDTNAGIYQHQALVANNPSLIGSGGPGRLTILGGLDDCFDIVPEGVTELHGNDGILASVLFIRGHDVIVDRLRLTRGDATTSSVPTGGGIYYQGAGQLEIRNSVIDNNDARRGGGLAVEALGGDARVKLMSTLISGNRATSVGGGILLLSTGGEAELIGFDNVGINQNFAAESGGGVALGANSSLFLGNANLQVDLNSTLGDGGAIFAVPPVLIEIAGSPVAGTDGTFTRNEAENGGAIAIGDDPGLRNGVGVANVRLTSNYPGRPQSFAFNRAHARGGVLAINGAPAMACSWNIAIWGNSADSKGSIAALSGADASYRHEPTCDDRPACPGACNLIQANTEPGGQPVGGSLYSVENGATLGLSHARLVQNTAAYLFREIQAVGAAGPSVYIADVLLAWNTGESILTQGGDESFFQMQSTTVAGNALSGTAFVNTGWFFASDSILDDADNPMFSLDPLASDRQELHRVLHNSTYQGESDVIWRGAPTYINAPAMDYRLTSASLGIDVSPDDPDTNTDAFGRSRTVDIEWRPDRFGRRDLGAIETQEDEDDRSDAIFIAGFEAF